MTCNAAYLTRDVLTHDTACQSQRHVYEFETVKQARDSEKKGAFCVALLH